MKLQKDAKIFTVDGHEIGSLTRFVLDPRSKNVTNIVFSRGLLSKGEYIVPMRVVDHVDETGIYLSQLPVDSPDKLSPFKEEEFIVADENAMLDETQGDDRINSYYYYPPTPLGTGNLMHPNDLFMNTPGGSSIASTQLGVPITGVDTPVVRKTEENIPEGTVSLKEGSKVFTNDGKHVGNIERMFVDSASGRVTHLVISRGLLLKERKQIPVDWINDILEDEVHLAVNASFVDRLPDFQEH